VKKLLLLSLTLWTALAWAAPEGKLQYITDEVTATMRDAPRMEAGVKGNLRSGTHVYVLESLGPDSFARVRTEDGKEGWIPARYVSDVPAAKERLQPLQNELKQARERIAALERDLAQGREAIAKAAPALQLVDDNEKLKAQLMEQEKATLELQRRYSEEESRRKTLITGAALAGGGVIAGLLLPLAAREQRRRGGF
jgi:SH3 domain protein